jgi:hypothetical protein
MKFLLVLAIIAAVLLLIYALLSKSRKRFVRNLLSQVLHLIPRYFV